jgi:hypothetical protein
MGRIFLETYVILPILFFKALSHNLKSDYQLYRVRLSVRMEERVSHWTDLHEIWYLSSFRKSVEKIQVALKSDKNKEYFA